MKQCMQYAVDHNHEVKRAALQLDNHRAAKVGAIGRFLPSVDAGVGAQYNFGRAIDPETNIYTNVSTFYNGYQLSASLPVFDGFGRVHALRAAKASVLMGQSALREQQNLAALNVMKAYVDALYYEELAKMADEKVEEMRLLLKQTRLLEEVGRKRAADVAQVESQKAEADYEQTRQQNLRSSALLELKKEMGLPLDEELRVKGDFNSSLSTLHASLSALHSSLQIACSQMQVAKHEWCQARASLYPTLSLGAGLNTAFYHTLHSEAGQPFHSQLKNNMGEYVTLTMSIPLFNRLQTITSIRKAKNNYRMACENYEQKLLELDKLSREAWQDWQGYQIQVRQMAEKVEADSIAYELTRRQFEEGLSTAIDLRNTSAQLLNSRATLLQCRLMAVVKEHLVRYYRGETIWE
jgi:outer membrane protein